ncbi:MBL fold metallo-hydrolase [Paenibacillus daejeonensis]|uniref:MBL fold metallo-hydrolase n=1 Tax=Paenibacillus daejeonensis TaxID=135193 RepID=UPI000381904B|nr:MBL fold metallo-hydrolase [Paenibacillus daejeonensis]
MTEHIEVAVWGGAGEHGRSCYHFQAGETSVLLDCGGKKEHGGQYPALVAQLVRKLKAVFLSHAHEDHMAALPLLLQHGYTGEVWLTRETHRQLPGYAKAWRRYVQSRGGTVPYGPYDWERMRYRFLDDEAPQGEWASIAPGLRAAWGPSGHLPGAVWLLLELEGRLAFFSGDYSSESTLLQSTLPPAALFAGRSIELALLDAAYGDAPGTQTSHLIELTDKLAEVHARGGHSLLPVPTCGRGMDLLVELIERLPELPIAAEASLTLEWARMLRPDLAAHWLRDEAPARLASAMRRIRTVTTDSERRHLLSDDPHVILSPDGMMLAEPALTYSRLLRGDPRHAVIFTGHRSSDARTDEPYSAEIASCRYKVHQGLPDVQQMLRKLRPQRALLVHAETGATARLTSHLLRQGYSALNETQVWQQLPRADESMTS